MTSSPPVDWGIGNYERTAAQLLPAARVLVERAAPTPGERVVDVGCGTGNAALLAAARGARVTGVDPAARLLEVAREQAATDGVGAEFVGGDVVSIPLADGEADLVTSVFGVIFAPDPVAAAAEMARVAAPDGRIVLSAWIPVGPISETGRLARETVTRVLNLPPGPPPFAWHELDALAGLFEPHGFEVTTEEHEIAFTAPSVEEQVDGDQQNHPLAIAGRAVLAQHAGELEALREKVLRIYEHANEDPNAFKTTSRYVIATAQR